MDFLLIVVLYAVGLGMMVAESMMPGVIIGLIGTALLSISIVFGFKHHWAIGTAQIASDPAAIVTFASGEGTRRRASTRCERGSRRKTRPELASYAHREPKAVVPAAR